MWDHQRQTCVPTVEPAEDLYDVLEVSDTVDLSEIKKNYRRLSVMYHPDKNPGQGDKFNAIRDAYEVLSEPDKRVLYDTGGMQAVRDAAQGKAQKGEAMAKTIELTLEDFYRGARRTIELRRRVICRKCRRTQDPKRCNGCSSCPPSRRVVATRRGNMIMQQEQKVPSTEDCKTETSQLEVGVDPGSFVGDTIIFKHMGSQMPGQVPGDLTVTLKQRKSKTSEVWRRRGKDLQFQLNVTLREALLGFERTLRHLDGHTVEVKTRSISRPGQVIHVEGEGMPVKDTPSLFGDLELFVSVAFPQVLTSADREELEGVRALRPPSAAGSSSRLPDEL